MVRGSPLTLCEGLEVRVPSWGTRGGGAVKPRQQEDKMAAANGSFSSPRPAAAAAATTAPAPEKGVSTRLPRLTWPGARGSGTGA